MIIVSVTGPTTADALRQMRESRRWADVFELRLDLIRDPDLPLLMGEAGRPRLVTVRPRWEGGKYEGSEDSRCAMLKRGAACGAEFLDVELKAGRRLVDEIRGISPAARIIVSLHTSGVPSSAARIHSLFAGCGGDVVKWAYPAGDSPDLVIARDFLQSARRIRQKAIAVAMGEAGEASRILYRVFGGWATYACAEGGPAAAEGQLPASTLAHLCRSRSLNERTRVFGLLGNPVVQSEGMALHNALFRARKLNAVYVRLRTTDFERFFEKVLPLLEGCSVTLPFKEQVAARVRRRDPGVSAIGAANTLYRDGGVLRVANTDAPAGLDAIERRGRVSGKTLVVIGAGGAARAMAYEGKKRGARVLLASRTRERALVVAGHLGITAISLADVADVPYEILANATPVGMFPHPDEMPVSRSVLRPGTIVFDAIANPRVTRLLREAKAAGARVIPGREMFLRQAARQQELFLHRRMNLDAVRRALPAGEATG